MRFIYLAVFAAFISFSAQAMDLDLERYAKDNTTGQFIHQSRPTRFDEFKNSNSSSLLRLGHNLAEIDSQFIGRELDKNLKQLQKTQSALAACLAKYNLEKIPNTLEERLAIYENVELIHSIIYAQGYQADNKILTRRHETLTKVGPALNSLLGYIHQNPHVVTIEENFSLQLDAITSDTKSQK